MSVDDGLRALFRKHLPTVDWQSVETAVNRGVPDSNYCYQGYEGWIECKSTDHWSVDLRPEQIGWIARRVRHGGRVWIAVRRRHDGGKRRGPAVDELYLIRGENVKTAKLDGLRGCPYEGKWRGGPSRWDWQGVLNVLCN